MERKRERERWNGKERDSERESLRERVRDMEGHIVKIFSSLKSDNTNT